MSAARSLQRADTSAVDSAGVRARHVQLRDSRRQPVRQELGYARADGHDSVSAEQRDASWGTHTYRHVVNFLKLSARLAALGLTGVGLGPSRSFFVAEASAAPDR